MAQESAEQLADACEELLARAETSARERSGRWVLADQMLVGLPSSHLRGRAWTIIQRRPRPERAIDESELTALLARALRLAVNRLVGDEGPNWLLVDAAPVSLTVDGRRVTDPVGFRAQEVGATAFAALVQMDTVVAWQVVAETLEFSTLTLTPAPLALAASMKGSQGVLVDVGGSTTDLTWWRAGRPLALDSLPLGGTLMTRALTSAWNLSADRAKRLMKAYAEDRLDEEARFRVSEVLSPALETWKAGTVDALSRLNQEEPLPERFFLLGGGAALPDVVEAVRSLAWCERLQFDRYPQVDRLRPTDVPGVVNRTDMGKTLGDVSALALAAWACHQDQAVDRPTRILGEFCQVYDQDG
jgi:cell division ATPase FtsA